MRISARSTNQKTVVIVLRYLEKICQIDVELLNGCGNRPPQNTSEEESSNLQKRERERERERERACVCGK
jgi:hypothetical protein